MQIDIKNAHFALLFMGLSDAEKLLGCGFLAIAFYIENRNLVLEGLGSLLDRDRDDTKEFLKDPDDPYKLLDETRSLGLTVSRGTSVMLVCPTDGFEEIATPFLEGEGEEGEEPVI